MSLVDLLGARAFDAACAGLLAWAPGSWLDAGLLEQPGLTIAVLAGAVLLFLIPASYFLLRPYEARVAPRRDPEAISPVLVLLPPVAEEPPTTYPSAPAMMHATAILQRPWYQQRPHTLESAALPPPSPDALQSVPVVFDDSRPALPEPPLTTRGLGPSESSPLPPPPPPPAVHATAPSLPPQPPARIPSRPSMPAHVDAIEGGGLPDFDDKPTTLFDRAVPPPAPRPADTARDVNDIAFDPTVTAAPEDLPPSRVPTRPVPLPPPVPPPRHPSAPRIRATAPTPPRTPPPPKPPSVWGTIHPSPPRVDPNETAALTPVSAPTAPSRPRPRS